MTRLLRAWCARFLLACTGLGVLGAATAAPWGADYLPNVPLTTHHGKPVRLYDDLLKGKKVAIALMYTSCSASCPLITARMVELRRALGDRVGRDVFFYSISIDPWDTPDVLKAYADKFGAGGAGWEFLTGREEDVALVIRKLGLSRASDRGTPDGHSPVLMVGDVDRGQWMRNSAVDNPQFLAATMLTFLQLGGADPGPSYAQAKPIVLDRGRALFEARCAGCHTRGQGERLGPDLADVSKRHDRAWIQAYLRSPAQMRANGDPVALELARRFTTRMPAQALGRDDLASLLDFLDTSGPRTSAAGRDGRAVR
jgi:protein SCO1